MGQPIPAAPRPSWRTALMRRRGLLLGFVGVIVVVAIAWQFCFFQGCPDVHKLGAHVAGGAPVLLDRNGREFADLAPVPGELVELSSLPKHVGEAFIAVEDQRFREHGAVDPLGVSGRPRVQRSAAPVAGWFVEEVRRDLEQRIGSDVYRQRMRIHTTLDLNAQRAAEEELARQLTAIESGSLGAFKGPRYAAAMEAGGEQTPYLQGAVVAVEVSTGDVVAWVGGRDFRHSHFDRVKQARRQAGSAFKPFVYAAALPDPPPVGDEAPSPSPPPV